MFNTKKIPHYDLQEIKSLIESGDVFITETARCDADYIGMVVDDIYNTVLSLEPKHLYKSMKSEKNPLLWQDVYHYTDEDADMVLYIKLQINKKAVVISFKQK